MAKTKRLFKSFFRALFPIVVLLTIAFLTASVWLVHESSQPKSAAYLVTPQKYGQLSSRAAQVTDETWSNADGTGARGWLLRGTENAPAIILLHKYGADRSYTLNLGVKLSEATNFTILMPDQRGHGQNPPVKFTSFGGRESDDVASAIKYLRSLKTSEQIPIVGSEIGIYGVELGSLAAMSAASRDATIRVLVLDSVPRDSDAVLASAIGRRFPFASAFTSGIARLGTNLYFYDGSYSIPPPCDEAKLIVDRKVLLLGGVDAPDFQDSTNKVGKCFVAGSNPQAKVDLSPSGYSITNASIEQSEAYDQRVIDFFQQSFVN